MKKRVIGFRFFSFYEKYAPVIFIAIFYLIGIIAGAISRNYIGHQTEVRLLDLFKALTSINLSVSKLDIFMASAVSNFLLFFLIFFFGLSVIGIPFIILLNTYKGFGIGFTFGFICSIYGFKGILICALTLLPQAIILSYLYIKISFEAVMNSYSLAKFYGRGARTKADLPSLFDFSKLCFILFLFSLSASFYDTFISPFFIRLLCN